MTQALQAAYEHLEEMTRTDELTGLSNRRHLDSALETELARARREKAPLAVLMLDLTTSRPSTIDSATPKATPC